MQVDEPLSRAEFERFVEPLMRVLDGCVDRLLARTQLSPSQIDAVFLTGGTSQIPAVQQLFRDRFGGDRLRSADAFTSVAAGLGRSAAAGA